MKLKSLRQCAVLFSRGPQRGDLHFITARGGVFLHRAYLQLVVAGSFDNPKYSFRPMRAIIGIHLDELGAVRAEQRYHHINSALIHHDAQELAFSERDPVAMALAARHLTLDSLPELELSHIAFFLSDLLESGAGLRAQTER